MATCMMLYSSWILRVLQLFSVIVFFFLLFASRSYNRFHCHTYSAFFDHLCIELAFTLICTHTHILHIYIPYTVSQKKKIEKSTGERSTNRKLSEAFTLLYMSSKPKPLYRATKRKRDETMWNIILMNWIRTRETIQVDSWNTPTLHELEELTKEIRRNCADDDCIVIWLSRCWLIRIVLRFCNCIILVQLSQRTF